LLFARIFEQEAAERTERVEDLRYLCFLLFEIVRFSKTKMHARKQQTAE
jgi:hypothetical protein